MATPGRTGRFASAESLRMFSIVLNWYTQRAAKQDVVGSPCLARRNPLTPKSADGVHGTISSDDWKDARARFGGRVAKLVEI